MDQKTEIEALLEWINRFPVGDWIDSPKSLRDGQKIWAILRDIDPNYFSGNLPKGSNTSGEWVSRWQNLKQILKLLVQYLVNQCGKSSPKEAAIVDLQAIAMDHPVGETVKFLKLILSVAINCPKRETYIAEITKLSTSTQMALMDIISRMEKNGEEKSDFDKITSPLPTPIGDPELLYEERLGELIADNDNHIREKKELQKDLRELHDRLTRLQDNNDTLQERLTRSEDKLRVANSTDNAKNEASLKLMRSSLRQQEEVIAAHEISQVKYEQKLKELQTTIDKLTASSIKHRKLSDDLDVLKAERDSLAKKANTAERYKQKLEASQNLQKENAGLREELNEVREQLKSAQSARDRAAGLEVAIEEYQRTLPKIEQDRHELQIVKQHLEFDNDALAQRCEAANEQIARDKETIANLNDKLRDVDGHRKSDSINGKGLATELSEIADEEMQLKGELQTENRQLKATVDDQESKIKSLQQLLNDANTRREAQESEHLETHRRLLNIESKLAAAAQGEKSRELTYADSESSTGRGDNLVKENQKHTQSNINGSASKEEDALDELEQNVNALFESVKANSAKQQADIEVSREEHTLSDQKAEDSAIPLAPLENKIEYEKDLAAEKIQSQQLLINNLKRENKLMASAYHAMGSRLQMTNITLQRPSDISWLSRQRKAVDHPMVALRR